jgi:hypothetical protein
MLTQEALIAPCLVLAYTRPIAKQIVEPLLKMGAQKIYVAFDGPKNEKDASRQSNQIEELKELSKLFDVSIEILIRVENLGLNKGIPEAIDWFFRLEEEGIIIEDDLRFELNFINFISKSLKDYRELPVVENISGNQFFPENNHNERHYSTYPLIWGWGTWRDRWVNYRNSKPLRPSSEEMNKSVSGYWEIGFKRTEESVIDSWAIPYARYQHFSKRVTLLPCYNLSSNVGSDQSATHSTGQEWYLHFPISKKYCFPDIKSLDQLPSLAQETDKYFEQEIFSIKFRHRFVRSHLLLTKTLRKIRNKIENS